MNTSKPSRRKSATKKLEPIDWHEFANDAVLQGNMSTLYRRPAAEDPSAYASSEALLEISKRLAHPARDTIEPTVGILPTEGAEPTDSRASPSHEPTVGTMPTEGSEPPATGASSGHEPTPIVGIPPTPAPEPVSRPPKPTVGIKLPVGTKPTAGPVPTVGRDPKQKLKAIRNVQDALTLAGQVLYKAMYGVADGSTIKGCTKGYRQLAAETHLDKDTVRDLISEFKEKGIARETGTYDPDTRSSKTYEILSNHLILEIWREAGVLFVTTGRQRPTFCTSTGEPLMFRPTVGTAPRAPKNRRPLT